MRVLLDTSVFLFLTTDYQRISKAARQAIDSAEERVLSVASSWEIAIKASLGKLSLPLSASEWIGSRAAAMLVNIEPVLQSHACAVEQLPLHHRDPFDRLLVAHALIEDLTIITSDHTLTLYPARVIVA